jgi:hypothetical protein
VVRSRNKTSLRKPILQIKENNKEKSSAGRWGPQEMAGVQAEREENSIKRLSESLRGYKR